MLGIFAIVCLTSYITVNIISDHLMNRGSDKTGKLGSEPRRYETCRPARPLIVVSQIILLVGWIGCFWPFWFIEGLEKGEFIGLVLLGIAPAAAFAFAIYLTLTDKSGFISISDEKIEFHRRRKQLTINAGDIIKISYPGLGTFRIHFKDKNTKDIQLCINNFNCQKEIISLMKQFREHVAIANNRQNSFAHKYSPWGFEMFFGKIYLPCCRYGIVLVLFYTSWCCIDYDFFKKDYTKEFNALNAIDGETENAWDYYVKAAVEYSQLDEDMQETITEQTETGQLDLDEQQTQELKQWYQNNTSALANLKKAASIDYCNAYYDNISFGDTIKKHDFSSPSDTGYGYIKKLYTNLNACRLLSIIQLEWTDLFEMQLASARHFTNGKGTMDQLVGYSSLSKAIKLISLNNLNTADLEKARQLLNKYFPEGVRPLSLEGELLTNCAWYESFINTKGIPRQTPLNPFFIMCGPISGAEKHFRKRYTNAMEQAAKGIEIEGKSPAFFSFPIMRDFFLLITEPSIFKIHKLSERADSHVSAAYVAIDLEKYKFKNGTYPSKLSDLDLTSKLPEDPHSDNNIVYRLDENRVVLYSVGSNAIDDGGHRDKNKKNRKRDDVIYWERNF